MLDQKLEVAMFYAARRFQLQSHETDYYADTWDRRFLEKDIKKKVEDYLGFNNEGMRKFLSLREIKLDINRSGTWTKMVLTARNRAPRIRFLCNYNKDRVCERDEKCLKGYNFCVKQAERLSSPATWAKMNVRLHINAPKANNILNKTPRLGRFLDCHARVF